ncbi:xanthine dehydrogenase family protein molybdopterin-binding subunit [Desulforhopalus singaporensis]|uniref:Carbon-monoxide dehydrogenase large subunit n=1 Tax=Desulforhopalus singaporensis TaxID=91360 RepID=A0A1H0RSG5_9BACT|nr:xanthine dehydrogenase family protein molybdopterin-binding subunit [Desulforhopalus singaporensis]SDP32360.1 carbon-monoxide dehydrogenase large subunit [Desulforhopalus singaporensis]
MKKREDRLIMGKGQYADDLEFSNMAHLVFVGSPHGHAKIVSINVEKALQVPGVVRIITGRDVMEHSNPLPVQADFKNPGWIWRLANVHAMDADRVRWFGEPVAAVIAEDEDKARIAADLVEVEYDLLEVTASVTQALEPGAVKLYDDWEDNKQVHLVFDFGDPARAFDMADQVLKVTNREGRVTGVPIEPRGCVGLYDRKNDTLEMWGSFQTPFLSRHNIAATLGIAEAKVKINAVDIGGAFGLKIHAWKENIVALASKLTGRPVKWMEPHRDFITTGPHQRDVYWEGEIAFNNDGTLLGLKAEVVHDLGVESTNKGIAALSIFPACSAPTNMYKWVGMHVEGIGVVTNKSFYCAYRGYGKDKGIKFIEAAVNQVARHLGMTPEEIRFKNFIQPDEFPYHQINNYVLDSGDYPAVLQKAMELANIDQYRTLKSELEGRGRYLGIGLVTFIEPAGVAVPNCQMGGITQARVLITPDGSVEVHSDRTEIGQGSEISHATIVADILGVKKETVHVKKVTSDFIGQGPLSSRGAVYPASAVAKAARLLKEKVVQCAASVLKADQDDVVLEDGFVYSSAAPDIRLTYQEFANKVFFFPGPRGLDPEILKRHEHLLDVTTTWYSPTTPESGSSYTSFCVSADVAVVEVDVDTGVTEIKKYVHVHDAGTIINKQVIDGQIHGGIVQGIGEALYECLDYDLDGQLKNTSFSTYLIPTAVEAPDIEIAHLETPSPFSETGAKGMGEAPIIGSKAVILDAIEDALSSFNVRVNDSPATPEKVRRWINQAMSANKGDL